MNRNINLPECWLQQLQEEFEQPYMQSLRQTLIDKKANGHKILPPNSLWFSALNLCPFNQVKVVILGQDPYHGINQANGLSFSVSENITRPPSLNNIFKELIDDYQLPKEQIVQQSNDLSRWAKQGVLLLNSVLTVEQSSPASHANLGWEQFTNAIIRKINDNKQHVVFILWGRYAQKKADLVDSHKHHIIKSAHPSPFSAASGFFGSRPFSRTNDYLQKHNLPLINWH